MTHVPASSHGGGAASPTTLTASTPTEEPLVINGAASQSQDVFTINASGVAVPDTFLRVDSNGNVTIQSGGTHQEATLQLVDTTPGTPGVITLDTFLGATIRPEPSSNAALKVQPNAGHTGRLVSIFDTGGVEGLAITPGAYLLIATHTAPANAALAAGECALWFDQTNAAAKLMAKGKTADGTVVAASIAMA